MLELSKRFLLKNQNIPQNAIWFHVASVGEFNSIRFLVDYISSKYPVFITYFSPRAKIFFDKLSYCAFPMPLDFPVFWKKFFDLFRPCCLIMIEKEFWPFLINSNIPKILLNARMPKSIFDKYFIKRFDMIIAKDQEAFESIRSINKHTINCGNIKLCFEISCEGKKDSIVIGSTHQKEEELLLDTVKWIKTNTNFNIIIAPRHIDRAKEVYELLLSHNMEAFLKTKNKHAKLLILDTIGELNDYYKRAFISIVGGSFVEGYGGHNIAEPVAYCSYVIYGDFINKITDMANLFEHFEIGFRSRPDNTIDTIKYLISKPFKREKFESLKSHLSNIKMCYIRYVEDFIKSYV